MESKLYSVNVYKDEEAPAIALLTVFIRKYGNDALEWLPDMVRHQIEKDYEIKLTDLQFDKLLAAITVLTSDNFETYWFVFEKLTHLFNNIPVDTECVEVLEPEEIIIGITHARLIKHEPIDFDIDVLTYAGQVFHDYGYSRAPELFSQALVPNASAGDMDEINENLKELFEFHVNRVADYMARLKE